MRITNAKYSRNALLFNVCFVVDEAADVHCYKPVVKKLAAYLTSLEVGLFRIRNFRYRFTSKIFHVCKEYRECGQACNISLLHVTLDILCESRIAAACAPLEILSSSVGQIYCLHCTNSVTFIFIISLRMDFSLKKAVKKKFLIFSQLSYMV